MCHDFLYPIPFQSKVNVRSLTPFFRLCVFSKFAAMADIAPQQDLSRPPQFVVTSPRGGFAASPTVRLSSATHGTASVSFTAGHHQRRRESSVVSNKSSPLVVTSDAMAPPTSPSFLSAVDATPSTPLVPSSGVEAPPPSAPRLHDPVETTTSTIITAASASMLPPQLLSSPSAATAPMSMAMAPDTGAPTSGWTSTLLLVVALHLASGCGYTMSVVWQNHLVLRTTLQKDPVVVRRPFAHPFIQAFFILVGQGVNLPIALAIRWMSFAAGPSASTNAAPSPIPHLVSRLRHVMFLLVISSLLETIETTLLIMSLTLMDASVFSMIRISQLVFATTLQAFVLPLLRSKDSDGMCGVAARSMKWIIRRCRGGGGGLALHSPSAASSPPTATCENSNGTGSGEDVVEASASPSSATAAASYPSSSPPSSSTNVARDSANTMDEAQFGSPMFPPVYFSRGQLIGLACVVAGVLTVFFAAETETMAAAASGVVVLSHTPLSTAIGCGLVLFAMLILSIELAMHEHILRNYHDVVNPMELIGIQGLACAVWSFLTVALINTESVGLHDDLTEFLVQMSDGWVAPLSLMSLIFCATAVDASGTYLTKFMSANVRPALQPIRSALIWTIGLLTATSTFSLIRLTGFSLSVFGALVFKRMISPFPTWLHVGPEHPTRRN